MDAGDFRLPNGSLELSNWSNYSEYSGFDGDGKQSHDLGVVITFPGASTIVKHVSQEHDVDSYLGSIGFQLRAVG